MALFGGPSQIEQAITAQMGKSPGIATATTAPSWKPPGKMLTVAACEVGGFIVYDPNQTQYQSGALVPVAAFTTIQEALDFIQNKMLLSV